jgi:hypothetical protein
VERTGRRGGVRLYKWEGRSREAWRGGCGVLSRGWPGERWCRRAGARRARRPCFWMDAGGQRWRGGLAVSSSPVDAQVFDGGDGVITGKGEGVAVPVGCWGGLGLACMNERDRERAWCRVSAHVQSDVARAGWGSIGGEGARAWEWARLGNTRDAGVLLRTLVWSEG